EPCVHLRTIEHHVAAKGELAPLALQQVCDAAGAIAARVHANELAAAPYEGVIRPKRTVQRNGCNRRPHVTRAMNRELVSKAYIHLTETRRFLEQFPLHFWRRDLCPGPFELLCALALLAVM